MRIPRTIIAKGVEGSPKPLPILSVSRCRILYRYCLISLNPISYEYSPFLEKIKKYSNLKDLTPLAY
jgi:hypothetical protein